MRIRMILLSTVAGLSVTCAAQAQSVNYGQLEQFFGEPVTTSAIGSPQKAADAPANLEIIGTDEIRRSGATNIPDILRFVSGLDLRQYSNGETEVSVRGYNQPESPRLLVLVNGRQVYNDDFGYTAWSSIPVQLDEIRQIEVIKGPNSALFGFNAVGGVINIITFDPLSDNANSVTARAGTDSYLGGSAVGSFHWGDTAGLRLSVGGYQDRDGSPKAQAPLGLPYDTSPYSRSFSADGRWQLAPTVLATFEGTSSQSSYGVLLPSYFTLDESTVINNSLKTGVAADTDLGLINLSAYRNDAHTTVVGRRVDFNEINVTYVAQVSDLFKIGTDNTIRIGGEYRNNALTSAILLSGTMGYQVYAASAMWNWQITPTLSLTNSVRLDRLDLSRSDPVEAFSPFTVSQYNNATLTEPSYNSGAVYKPTDDDTIRLLAGRGIQAPSLVDFGFQDPVSSVIPGLHGVIAGDPNVHAAIISNYEVDYDRALPALNSILRTAIYHQDTQNVLNLAITSSPAVVQFTPVLAIDEVTQNIGSSSANGGEIGIAGHDSTGWRWHASYAYEKISDKLRVGYSLATPLPIGFQKGTPSSTVVAGLGYSVGKWEADINNRWQTGYSDYQTDSAGNIVPVSIKSYLTSTARLGYYVVEKVQLAVTVEQLNQAQIIDTTGLPLDRRVLFNVTSKF